MLLEQSADDDEVASAIDDRARTMLPAAVEAIDAAMVPATLEELTGKISAAASLFGSDWTVARFEEFIYQATCDLQDLPGDLVLDAIKRSRRFINRGSMFVPWICQDVDSRAAALQVEHTRIHKLAELAGIGG